MTSGIDCQETVVTLVNRIQESCKEQETYQVTSESG
jgi:hypothetical protein